MPDAYRIVGYALISALLGLLWWGEVRRERRGGLVNRRGFLLPLGAALLFVALSFQLDALIGLAVALALIGYYAPDLRARPRRRPEPEVHTFARWQPSLEPAHPDIELHLEATGAKLRNVGGETLLVRGWSPADQNAWLSVRADDGSGAPIQVLPCGEWARLLPWPVPNRGVRVWYTREGEADQQWLFRADWAELNFNRTNRELN